MLVVGLIIVGTGIYAFAGPGLITAGCVRSSLGAGVLMLALVGYGCRKLQDSNWAQDKRDAIREIKSQNATIKQKIKSEKRERKMAPIIEVRKALPYADLVRTTFPEEFRGVEFHEAENPFDRSNLTEAMGDHPIVLFPRADETFTWLALAIEHLDSEENLMSCDVLLLSVSLHPGGGKLLQYYAGGADNKASCFEGFEASKDVLMYQEGWWSESRLAAISNWIQRLLSGEDCVKINLESEKSSENSSDLYRLRRASE